MSNLADYDRRVHSLKIIMDTRLLNITCSPRALHRH